jgi:four helix bundle protein
MLPIRSHRDLVVWQEAMALAELCYKRTSNFPALERYGLMSQIRRAVVSVASNIAEGHGRRTLPAYLSHLSIALGSQAELETQIELSHRLVYLNDSEANEVLDLAGRVGRRLHALMRSLEERNGTVSSFSRTQRLVSGSRHPEPNTQHLKPNTQHLAPNTHREVTA